MSTQVTILNHEIELGLLQAYVSTVLVAVAPILLGSFDSLSVPKSHKLKSKKEKSEKEEEEDDEDDDDEELSERITWGDAAVFPILGSATLGGLFLVFKYLDKEWINWLLSWYFSMAGCLALWKTSTIIISGVIPGFLQKRFPSYHVLIHKNKTEKLLSTTISCISLAVIPSSVYLPYLYISAVDKKPWWLNNVIALSLAHNSISLMKLDSFLTGVILLSGLFFYDIYWVFYSEKVFGTSVMVSVAKSLEVPVKLLFPKSGTFSEAKGFTMLGLGDIVIPGIFISLALRYDFHRYLLSQPSTLKLASIPKHFPKPYFITTVIAYAMGMVTTIVVMHVFHAAQPALLYLSPACVGAVLLVAMVKGDATLAWGWEDGEPVEKEKNENEVKQVIDQSAEKAKADSQDHQEKLLSSET